MFEYMMVVTMLVGAGSFLFSWLLHKEAIRRIEVVASFGSMQADALWRNLNRLKLQLDHIPYAEEVHGEKDGGPCADVGAANQDVPDWVADPKATAVPRRIMSL